MKQQPCDPNRENSMACPVFAIKGYCHTDTHHTEYPRRAYTSPLEKAHREQDFNKVDICRALHNAIHATPYKPDKLSKDEMAAEIWEGSSDRAEAETELQIALGKVSLQQYRPLEQGDTA